MKRSSNRATTTVAHAFLEIAYHLIGRQQTYQDLGYDYFDRLDRERVRGRLVARLERLGFEVRLAQQVQARSPQTAAGQPNTARAATTTVGYRFS